jgi:hypothetical protein
LRNRRREALSGGLLAGNQRGGAPVRFAQKEAEERHELHMQLPAAAPDPSLSVIVLDLDGAARVDPSLIQQPDGKVTLSGAFAQAEGPHLNIRSGIALNWLNPARSLRWTFRLYRPGTYEVVALTTEEVERSGLVAEAMVGRTFGARVN